MPRLSWLSLLACVISAIPAIPCCAAEAVPWNCSFEQGAALPADWRSAGTVTVSTQGAFKGAQAVDLTRDAAGREQPCSAIAPAFPVTPGTWEFSCATASDLESPDASFNGVVAVELLDAAGKSLERTVLADPYGKRPWQLARKRVVVPDQAVAARFSATLNKTIGRLRIDELGAIPVADARKPSAVNRMVFSSHALGNMLLPDESRVFTITVEALRELTPAERVVTWAVRDYWGAEQAPLDHVQIAADGRNQERYRYRATVDLAALPLEQFRYYEIQAEVPLADGEPYRNWSSLVIMPQAASKAYPPNQIPFTSRTWDNRYGDYLRLADRLGVRIAGIWGRTKPEAPYVAEAPALDVAAKLGMGALTSAPNGTWNIEHHSDGYQKWTDEALRAGVDSWFTTYGKHQPGPLVVNLGNEPNNTGERLKEAVHAYQVTYDEIKKVAPDTVVVATSIGATEEYFQLGYQNACDAFDFHVYESPRNVRIALLEFKRLMAKYHCVKPVWSTEIGLNSQGMTRQYIAGDMARKTAAFFAEGGANMSWFGFMYPDPDAKIFGSTEDAFNMFDSRYLTYGPRLDALMHASLINGMLIKKFVNERTWTGGLNGCLFRDEAGACFAILWKDQGSVDVTLPLSDVGAVRCVRIDGRHTTLQAGAQGIGLTIGEDPLLLEYNGPAALPATLNGPLVRIASAPARLTRGVPAIIALATSATAADPQRLSLSAPPAWTVERVANDPLRFTVTSPENSRVKAGDLLVRLTDASGAVVAELGTRPIVTGKLDVEIRPVPAPLGGQPSAKVVISSRAETPQTVTWTFGLNGEQVMDQGRFGGVQGTSAYLGEAGSGTLTVPANSRQEIVVPLVGIDPLRLYQAAASITDATGATLSTTRALGGFAGVPHATKIAVDGVLDEAEWAKATPCKLDQGFQYFAIGKQARVWNGPADLSATLRCLWDETHFYIGVQVTDDVFANQKADGDIWSGDGLQFLFDPKRDQAEKPGKYDAGFAVGTKGPQAWYWLTGSSAVRAGLQSDITVAMQRGERGDATYEVAIPWDKLAPFVPGVGANLGACMIVNEDDGPGRTSFIGWFGNPHTKQIDTAGDLILLAP